MSDIYIEKETKFPTPGKLIVITGITASGKDTLMNHFIENGDAIQLLSYTTRPKRPGEVNGVDYHFISQEEFESQLVEGAFFQYRRTFNANGMVYYYGNKAEDMMRIVDGKNIFWRVSPDAAGRAVDIIEGNFSPEMAKILLSRMTRVFVGVDRLTVCLDRARNRDGGMDNAEILHRFREELDSYYKYHDQYDIIISNMDLESSIAQINLLLKKDDQ